MSTATRRLVVIASVGAIALCLGLEPGSPARAGVTAPESSVSAHRPAAAPMCPGSPAPPPVSITNLTRSGADLTWGSVPGAARYGYALAYLTPAGWTAFPDWTFVASPIAIRAQLEGATAFAYRISAQSYCGTGFAQGSCLGSPGGNCTRVDLRSRPAPPSAVTAAYEAGTLRVSWTPPADDGGSPVTGYQVTASPGGSACSVTATSCQVSLGLPAGTEVAFTVVATNAAGSSDPSPASSPIALSAGPAPPTSVKVSATTTTTATVTWTPAASMDASTTIRYLVTARPGGRTCQSTATSCRVTGLKPAATYRFEVVASAGSLASEPVPSDPVRLPQPAATPAAPRPAPRPAPKPAPKPSQNLT